MIFTEGYDVLNSQLCQQKINLVLELLIRSAKDQKRYQFHHCHSKLETSQLQFQMTVYLSQPNPEPHGSCNDQNFRSKFSSEMDLAGWMS